MRRLAALAVLFALSTAPVNAWGHGAPPAAQNLFLVEGEWVFVTNFGVMTPEFPGEYVCEEAFFGSDRFRVLPLELNRWVTFTRSRVSVSADGCDFEVVQDLPAAPTDVAMEPEGQEVIFTVQNEGDAEIWRSQDGGMSWAQVSVDLGGVRPAGLGFVGAGQAVLVAYETAEERRGEALLWSIDLATGAVEELGIEDGLLYPNLLDARDGEVLWHGRRGGVHEVFWMDAAGALLGVYSSPRWPTSGVIGPDAVYLGGVDEENRGVFRALRSSPDVLEEILPGHRALCMAAGESHVLVWGQRNHDDHDLLRWSAEGEVEELVDFRDLQGTRSDCPAGTLTAEVCPAVWPETARALSISVAEGPDAQSGAEEEVLNDGTGGCAGCAVAGDGRGGVPPVVLLLLGGLLMNGVKRRRWLWTS